MTQYFNPSLRNWDRLKWTAASLPSTSQHRETPFPCPVEVRRDSGTFSDYWHPFSVFSPFSVSAIPFLTWGHNVLARFPTLQVKPFPLQSPWEVELLSLHHREHSSWSPGPPIIMCIFLWYHPPSGQYKCSLFSPSTSCQFHTHLFNPDRWLSLLNQIKADIIRKEFLQNPIP